MTAVTVNVGLEDQEAIIGRIVDRGLELGQMALNFNAATGDLTLTWAQTLTASEVTAIQEAARAARSGLLTRTERNGIEDELAQIRTFRQQSQSEFIAKTQNQRDREIFDTLNSLITVQRTILRDG